MLLTEEQAREKWKRGRPGPRRYENVYPLAERLADLSIPEPNSGCIIWLGALNDSGYGRIKIRSRFRRAHRVAWELENGPIPSDLCIDHLCRVRCCINPTHMELVTRGENVKRGWAFKSRGLAGAPE